MCVFLALEDLGSPYAPLCNSLSPPIRQYCVNHGINQCLGKLFPQTNNLFPEAMRVVGAGDGGGGLISTSRDKYVWMTS